MSLPGLMLRSIVAGLLALGAACHDLGPLDVTPPGAFPITTLEVKGSVIFSARVTASGDTLRGALYLENPSSDTTWVDYGACSIGFRLYPSAARDNASYYNSIPTNAGCIDIGYRKGILPAQRDSIVAVTVQGAGTLPQVPPGHYWFSLVTVSINGVKQLISAGEADVP